MPQSLDTLRLKKLAGLLAIAFYALMGLAFLAAVFGSPGTGLLFLILGACAHVARVWSRTRARLGTKAARAGPPGLPVGRAHPI